MKKWKVLSTKQKVKEEILDILLSNRGIKTKKSKENFLNPKLENVTIENAGIKSSEIVKTIKRIRKAIEKNEKIIIFGDYDVDGICGTAILWETLFGIYKNVMPHIPHRIEEGYGLSIKGISHVLSEFGDVKLIITVDNGIVAHGAVEYAKKRGIDVIITDHHIPSEKVPKALSIVHTTQLCGAGVAYLLAQEIAKIHNSKFLPRGKAGIIQNSLELVTLATVADLVELTGLNRALVKFGIEALKETKRLGLLALFESAAIKAGEIDIYKIGHVIAPRLNASGRIAHAMDSLRLICTKDPVRAKKLAQHLSETNIDRQIITAESTLQADSVTEVSGKIIFTHDAKYNPGIIGLVASRLVDKHYIPAIVVSVGETTSKGSARSIPGFNIIEYLRKFSDFLIDVGGHPMAAGFTIETSKIEEFRAVVVEGSKTGLPDALLERILKIDLELSFNQINGELYSKIQTLAPFGMRNPEPLFVSRKIKVESLRFVGRENKHLKLQLSQSGEMFDAIYFNGSDHNLKTGDVIDVVYSFEKDSWNGNDRIQLKIRDVKT